MSFFIVCGQMMPTKPMMPRNDTQTAVIIEARSREKKRSLSTFTPIVRAAASPLKSALYRHDMRMKKTEPTATTASMMRSFVYVARPRSPKLQMTAAERPTSVA